MQRPVELWISGVGIPGTAPDRARRAEDEGWDGLGMVDSQNLAGDPFVALAMAATATTRLRLATAVTNSVTRHPAAAATAAATVQAESSGRFVLGIGRGDSALAHLGRSPATFASFERYIDVLQRYLRGEEVPFAEVAVPDAVARPVEDLHLADHPSSSRIRWLRGDVAKVPVEVAATGPKVIAMAGRLADRVMFTLGAVPERIRWGIEVAREARAKAGLDSGAIRFGAYVNMVCDPDVAMARALVRGGLTTFARFSVMHGRISGPASTSDAEVFTGLHRGYDMKAHTRADSSQAALMSDAFVDRFAIAGSPQQCLDRLGQLAELGLDKIVVSGPTAGTDREAARAAMQRLDEEVVRRFAP
jgi:5,10-methylenetetrahydromethanopterin reductase